MFSRAISDDAQSALALLGKSRISVDAYLAGGSACALYFGHRFSFDLDFFTEKEFQTEFILEQLKSLEGFVLSRTAEWTILGGFPGVKFSYFYLPHPLIGQNNKFNNINVASIEDIAAMKIAAIADRGTKRDFVDLYFIAKNKFSLDEAFGFYDKKYQRLANNIYHILRSLQYFSDAENQEIQMIEKASWEEIKNFFTDEVKRLSNKFLGLEYDLYLKEQEDIKI